MTKLYQVTLYSQMGPRRGTLTLECDGSRISGSLDLLGHRNTVQGTQSPDGTLRLFHPIQTALRTLACETVLECAEGQLTGESLAPSCRMRWQGRQIQSEAPDPIAKERKP